MCELAFDGMSSTMTCSPPICPGQVVTGSLFNEPMRVETVQANGPASRVIGLVGTHSERFRKVTLTSFRGPARLDLN